MYSLDELSKKWERLVKTVISFVTNKVEKDFLEYTNQEEILHTLGKDLTSFIYSIKEIGSNQAFDGFSELVEVDIE